MKEGSINRKGVVPEEKSMGFFARAFGAAANPEQRTEGPKRS
jgi:hypothetical protein